jgi:hypothetical protein
MFFVPESKEYTYEKRSCHEHVFDQRDSSDSRLNQAAINNHILDFEGVAARKGCHHKDFQSEYRWVSLNTGCYAFIR